MGKIRVLVVDDHPVMRRGVRDMLAGDPELEVCGEAEDAADALDLVRKSRPHLAIIDVSLPSGSGLDLVKRIGAISSETKVLILSMHDDATYAERALRAGALGYVNKSRPGEEVLAAIRKVLRGEIALSPQTADRLMRRAVSTTREARSDIECLSDRELEVFQMIGRGLTTTEIAERLNLSAKTIETHRAHIKSKLDLKSGTELTRRATLWANEQP